MSRIPLSDDTENDDPWEYDTGEYREYRPLDFDYAPPRGDLDVVDTFDSSIDDALETALEEDDIAEEVEEDLEPLTIEADNSQLSPHGDLISEILNEVDGICDSTLQ